MYTLEAHIHEIVHQTRKRRGKALTCLQVVFAPLCLLTDWPGERKRHEVTTRYDKYGTFLHSTAYTLLALHY